jgi:hypothetical protein
MRTVSLKVYNLLKSLLITALVGGMLLGHWFYAPSVDAAKKKKGDGGAAAAEAEIQKVLEPLQKNLDSLTLKLAGKGLFSPEETGLLDQAKYQLVELMGKAPPTAAASPLLAKPLYQAAQLFKNREWWEDAFDFFQFVSTRYPETPLGKRAGLELAHLLKEHKELQPTPDATASPSPAATESGKQQPASNSAKPTKP